jgi:antitoxin FitA
MAQFTVRNIEDDVKARLKQRALRHGTSLEAEIRAILRVAAMAEGKADTPGLGSRIAARFAKSGLTDPLPELHGQMPRPADLRR